MLVTKGFGKNQLIVTKGMGASGVIQSLLSIHDFFRAAIADFKHAVVTVNFKKDEVS